MLGALMSVRDVRSSPAEVTAGAGVPLHRQLFLVLHDEIARGALAPGDALPTEQMKTFLPETLGGLPRTNVAASRNAAMGFQVAEASADYADASGKSLRLEVNDAGGAKGVIALANWAGVEEEREWQGGYEKTYRADGRMIHERWDSSSGSGEYSLVVGDRFAVEVSGSAASMDELKAAMTNGVNLAGLETIAREAKPAS